MNNKNINSFADNVSKLVKSTNNAIASLNALNETMTTESDTVNIELEEGNNIQIPSYANLIHRMNTVERTVDSFSSGNGVVKLADGTHRYVKVSNLPSIPKRIEGVIAPSYFNIDANWFFESLMFPKIVINLDLTNQVDDDSDRIKVCRIIINNDDFNKSFYETYIKDKKLSYDNLIALLEDNNISYFKDEEVIDFPLTTQQLLGEFIIEKTEIINGELWYYINDVNYGTNGNDNLRNINLKINDTLKYKNSLYKIEEVDLSLNKIRIISNLGMDVPSIGGVFTIYESPFKKKEIKIAIGIDEINCIYLKGVNENYNLLANEWSEPINFISNELMYEDNKSETLLNYYYNNVSDFGTYWISQAKEKKIASNKGLKPNKPTLNENDFKVVQVNTQINAALNSDEIVKTASQIASLKTSISSSRDAIYKLKTNLTNTTIQSERFNIQNLIVNEENILSNNTTEYKSLVNHLSGFIKDNNLSVVKPKYRIRGFFPVPNPQYIYDTKNDNIIVNKQEVIGFEIRYRYLKLDDTGVELGTYSYSEKDSIINAVFSDWNIITSPIKERVYDADIDSWYWQEENVGDGNVININQIDIPITDGEKVEFQVRSISEVGYPNCLLKSDWSNKIIIKFPESLSTTDQLTNILEDVKSDATSIQLEEVMRSSGYYSHISDEMISGDNTKMYHHNADNIFYKMTKLEEGVTKVNTISVTDAIKDIYNRLAALDSNTENIGIEFNNLVKKIPNDLAKYDGSVYLINGTLYQQKFDSSGNLSSLVRVTCETNE